MRLLVATPLYPPQPGGPATYAVLLERYLPALDIEVTTVKFGDVLHLPPGVRHVAYFRKLVAAGKDADLILALDPVSVGLPALWASRALRKPYAVKIVGDYAWEQGVQRFGVKETLDEFVRTEHVSAPVARLRRIQTRVASHAKSVIVPSEYLKGIVRAWVIPEEHIRVVYNAIDIGTPSKAAPKLPEHAIVSVGRLVPWKGMKELIDALALVRKDVPDATLVVAGDGPERARLEAHAAEVAPGAVTFLGARPHDETLAVMQQAGAFALNSTYEGLSHTLIEAMMLGVPVVATKAGGNAELVTDGQDGVLVAPGDTPALAAALVKVLKDPVFAASVAERAAASSARFTPQRMAAATAAILTSLV